MAWFRYSGMVRSKAAQALFPPVISSTLATTSSSLVEMTSSALECLQLCFLLRPSEYVDGSDAVVLGERDQLLANFRACCVLEKVLAFRYLELVQQAV